MDQDRAFCSTTQPRVELWSNRVLPAHHLRHRGVGDRSIHQPVHHSTHSPRQALRLALG